MRFAGPRMTWRHPVRALRHLLDKRRKVDHPLQLRIERRQQRLAAAGDQGSQDSDRNHERPEASKP
jgi:hypothetical protein